MLVEPDRMKLNRLFEYVAKPLEASVAPGHLLRRIDQHIDFRRLTEPLHEAYVPDQRRPAIPPETLVRALVLGYVYRIPSFGKLWTAVQDNLAFRWFLYLGLKMRSLTPAPSPCSCSGSEPSGSVPRSPG